MKPQLFSTTMKERESIVLDTVDFGVEEKDSLTEQIKLWLGTERISGGYASFPSKLLPTAKFRIVSIFLKLIVPPGW